MDFELTDRCRDFQERLTAFMEERKKAYLSAAKLLGLAK